MKSVSHKFVTRLFSGLAAVALVLVGISVVAPSSAKAQGEETTAIIIGAVVTSALVLSLVVLDNDDDEESPQSP